MKGLHEHIARSHAKLQRGQVWCTSCTATQHVDPVESLRHGWPKHCGYTMTIDSPEERLELAGEHHFVREPEHA